MIKFAKIDVIYNKYLDTLYSYALHLGFDEQITMDAIHDVFYKLCTKHSSLNEISNLKSYLLRSLRNRLIDIKRTTRETNDLVDDNDIEDDMPFNLSVTIEDELIMKEDAEEIKKKVEEVLDQLTDRQREVVFLRYIQEYSYEETSEIMQISIAACRNLVSKSFLKIKNSNIPVLMFLLYIS